MESPREIRVLAARDVSPRAGGGGQGACAPTRRHHTPRHQGRTPDKEGSWCKKELTFLRATGTEKACRSPLSACSTSASMRAFAKPPLNPDIQWFIRLSLRYPQV